MMRERALTGCILCSALMAGGALFGAESGGEPGRAAGGKNPLKNVYFGEQHLHTTNSTDRKFKPPRASRRIGNPSHPERPGWPEEGG